MKQTTIRLPDELMDKLWQTAQERGDSFNGTVLRLLNKALKEK